MTFNIKEELKKLPNQPGVYIMHDASDAIIYVGKAVSLRNRVRQYFQACHDEGIKKDQMVKKITRFEYIITDSELEALVLECNLIKEYRPKYNTMLRDDKTYPYIKVTLGEEFPRVLFCRQLKKDKSRYFGPYTSAGAVKDTIDLLKKIYHLRTCNRVLPRDIGKERPCLNYHIHQCQAPCQGYISKEEYREKINQAVDFLNGNYQPVLKELEERMMQASENMDFERAIEYRELLNSVKQVAQKQKITSSDGEDKDIIALAADDRDAVVQVFFIRSGRLIGREHFYVTIANEDSKEQILATFLKQFYSGTPYIPKEIMLQYAVEDAAVIEDWLTKKRGQKVVLRVPQKGMKEKLVELAEKNAALVLSQDREKLKREEGRTIGAMKEIASWLDLEKLERVEAYDISNIQGVDSVGSMIVFEEGRSKNSDYRRFRIKTVKGANDYDSMREILTRRFSHGLEEVKAIQESKLQFSAGKFSNFPDLIMMDGGKGQINIALEVLRDLNINIPVCGLVKDDKHATRGIIYNNEELIINRSSNLMQLIRRIQDEVHRFAITYHRSLRDKRTLHSVLDDIPNVGEKRRRALLMKFGSVDNIKSATLEQLLETPSINNKAAESIYQYFNGNESK